MSWDTSIVGIQDEILGLGYANRLNGGVSLIGIFNGTLGEPEPWDMALNIKNTLQEARPSLPYEPTAAMGAFYASQQAYRIPIAPEGAGTNINYFSYYNCNDF